MKKNIVIFTVLLITLGLVAFGLKNRNNEKKEQLVASVGTQAFSNPKILEITEKRSISDFIYDVGPRFSPIKKADLDNVRSFEDFIDQEHAQRIVTYKSLCVNFIINDKLSDIKETGYGKELTEAQLNLLRMADYSSSFMIRADFTEKNEMTGKLEVNYSTPHLTIVPEKQAIYINGKEALILYLDDNSKDVRANVQEEQLQPAKLFFTVNTIGMVENVKLDRSSNYPLVDDRMIELITAAPGLWEPAENAKGEKVNQELVVSFGLIGC